MASPPLLARHRRLDTVDSGNRVTRGQSCEADSLLPRCGQLLAHVLPAAIRTPTSQRLTSGGSTSCSTLLQIACAPNGAYRTVRSADCVAT